MNKKLIRLTEGDLHRIVKESVERILNEESLNEGWKNWAMAGALGAASMFGGRANAQTVSNDYQDQVTQRILQNQSRMDSLDLSEAQVAKMCPAAYQAKNQNPDYWKQHSKDFVFTNQFGKMDISGQIAASHGENPWDAIMKKYSKTYRESKNFNAFDLSDFDIE